MHPLRTRGRGHRFRILAMLVAIGLMVASERRPAAAVCVGDCDGLDGVTINEIVHAVNIVLGRFLLSTCPNADAMGDGTITVDDVMAAVNSFLSDGDGCPMVMIATPTQMSAPTDTPTVTATTTRTATATATPLGSCGNGFLEPGESCDSCPSDCVAQECTATATMRAFDVDWAPPDGVDASSVTVLVGYQSNLVSLPGMGSAVSSRITNRPANSLPGVNDLDYALRVAITRSSALPPGRLFTVSFDACQGARVPVAADFGCTVDGCASSFGSVAGCTCEVVQP